MPLPVVTVASGGLPVIDVPARGLPVIQADSGLAVTKVTQYGMPAVFVEGGVATITDVGVFMVRLTGVNFNAVGDTAVNFTLPAGFTRYTILPLGIKVSGPSGAISTATYGLFSGTGGGGTAMSATITGAMTAAAENTTANMQASNQINGTTSWTFNPFYFRVIAAQGAPATANVAILIHPL